MPREPVILNISNQELETRVAELKAEGNALYLRKKSEAAANKYTQALQLDDHNVILYCNRAACRLAQSRYVVMMFHCSLFYFC